MINNRTFKIQVKNQYGEQEDREVNESAYREFVRREASFLKGQTLEDYIDHKVSNYKRDGGTFRLR